MFGTEAEEIKGSLVKQWLLYRRICGMYADKQNGLNDSVKKSKMFAM